MSQKALSVVVLESGMHVNRAEFTRVGDTLSFSTPDLGHSALQMQRTVQGSFAGTADDGWSCELKENPFPESNISFPLIVCLKKAGPEFFLFIDQDWSDRLRRELLAA